MTDLTKMCDTIENWIGQGFLDFDKSTLKCLVDGIRERDEKIKSLTAAIRHQAEVEAFWKSEFGRVAEKLSDLESVLESQREGSS
jgi:hypothetical protein